MNSIKRIGSTNATEVILPSGYKVLYSYSTPVAVRHLSSGQEWRTSKKFSSTTSKHLNRWCIPNAVLVTQETLERILAVGYNEALQRD